MPAPAAPALAAPATGSRQTLSPRPSLLPHRPSLHPHLSALKGLGVTNPFVDANGVRLPNSVLDRSFQSGLHLETGMSPRSGGRRQLLQAASVLVYHVLSLLAPDPLLTAAALAEQPRRASTMPDPLRVALSEPKVPKGRALLELIAEHPIVLSLVHSYICAEQRKEKMSAKAQILAPLTAGYSLRLFNECFAFQLAEAKLGPLTRYSWQYAKWHAAIWLSGQTPAISSTKKWHLKGAGDLGTLPHAKIVAAVEFLLQFMQHTAYGTHRVKTSDGWIEFSKTQRTQCIEALWKLFEEGTDAHLRLGRSHFRELAEMVAGETQKSYGALDSFAEQNGREQAKRLRIQKEAKPPTNS